MNDERGQLNRKVHGTLEVLGILFVDERREIATIVENHIERLSTSEGIECLLNAPRVFLLCLALPGKDGHASSGDSRKSMDG